MGRMVSGARDREDREEREDRPEPRRRRFRFRFNTVWIGLALVVILGAAYPIGYLLHNANASRAVAIFTIGVVSFLGMLSLGHQGARYRSFDSSEVRVAVTTAFVMVYFAVLGVFLFSGNRVSDFGRQLVGNLTSLYAVVVGFYFASSAVVEYGRARSGRRPPREGDGQAPEGAAPPAGDVPEAAPASPGEVPPPATQPGPGGSYGSLEAEVRALRELVTALLAERRESTDPQERPAGVR